MMPSVAAKKGRGGGGGENGGVPHSNCDRAVSEVNLSVLRALQKKNREQRMRDGKGNERRTISLVRFVKMGARGGGGGKKKKKLPGCVPFVVPIKKLRKLQPGKEQGKERDCIEAARSYVFRSVD